VTSERSECLMRSQVTDTAAAPFFLSATQHYPTRYPGLRGTPVGLQITESGKWLALASRCSHRQPSRLGQRQLQTGHR
jgi:hypothetical protein